jgi:hypothetical protein
MTAIRLFPEQSVSRWPERIEMAQRKRLFALTKFVGIRTD